MADPEAVDRIAKYFLNQALPEPKTRKKRQPREKVPTLTKEQLVLYEVLKREGYVV